MQGSKLCRYVKAVPFVTGRYTKGTPFLSKMVYKRVISWTLGWRFPVENFLHYPPRPPSTFKVLPADLSWVAQQFDFKSGGKLKQALLIKWYSEKASLNILQK